MEIQIELLQPHDWLRKGGTTVTLIGAIRGYKSYHELAVVYVASDAVSGVGFLPIHPANLMPDFLKGNEYMQLIELWDAFIQSKATSESAEHLLFIKAKG